MPSWDAETLLRELETSSAPILVDVREEREQAVSMLPGALGLSEYEAAGPALSGRVVIAYCTVGVRSGRWVRDARERGITAYNLEGGVLAWSWVGGRFFVGDRPTNRVHTWSESWNLLAEDYIAVW